MKDNGYLSNSLVGDDGKRKNLVSQLVYCIKYYGIIT